MLPRGEETAPPLPAVACTCRTAKRRIGEPGADHGALPDVRGVDPPVAV
jgi:hypothetical protein